MLESVLSAMFERAADAAFVVSDDGEIHPWNKAAERHSGFSPNKVLNKACCEVLQEVAPPRRPRIPQKVQSDGVHRQRYSFQERGHPHRVLSNR